MGEFGHFSLCLAWFLALGGIFCGVYAGMKHRPGWLETCANATMLVFVCTGLSLVALAYGFLNDDYTNQYIWQFSNKAMPNIYKVSAIWGGMDGSMLLWCGMLTLCGALVAYRSLELPRKLMPWVLAVCNSSSLFFLTVVVFLTNPFRALKSPFIPPDGNGLNPLLQNPYMAIRPPTLYVGFTTLSIPFAFCMGALLAGALSNEWIRLTRRWTLVAWGFLTAGIVLGGHWAYIELGWGGFWAWDPVENASFLPWLTASAFLHSVMVQERKNMLRFWNIWLVFLTYALTVFGTFLTRSGIVQSVHAFASADGQWIFWTFLGYLSFLFLMTLALTYRRRLELRSERKIESLLSREAAFLVNNLIFLSICFATLWGVMFPILSEAVTGTKQAVGIPFFNAVNVPFFLLLIFLTGVGPLIAWRKATLGSIKKTFMAPFISALVIACILVWAGVTDFYPVLSYSLCFFVLMTILGEFHRGLKVQSSTSDQKGMLHPGNVQTLFRRHRSRYGGYIVHLGVLILTVSITASMAHKIEKEFVIGMGEKYDIGRFSIRLDEVYETDNENYSALIAKTSILSRANPDEVIEQVRPELRSYKRNKESTTEVALRMGPREDVYVVVAGLDPQGQKVAFKVFINPLQIWLWVGAVIMIFGTIIIVIPERRAAVLAAEEEAARSLIS